METTWESCTILSCSWVAGLCRNGAKMRWFQRWGVTLLLPNLVPSDDENSAILISSNITTSGVMHQVLKGSGWNGFYCCIECCVHPCLQFKEDNMPFRTGTEYGWTRYINHRALNSGMCCIIWFIVRGYENLLFRPWKQSICSKGWNSKHAKALYTFLQRHNAFVVKTKTSHQGSRNHFSTHWFSGTNGPICSLSRTSPRWANVLAKEWQELSHTVDAVGMQ